MDILDTAISAEDGVGKLADALGVRQSVVSNWRKRGLPRPWRMVLDFRYGAAQPCQKSPPATTPQAPAAIESEAGEVAHG